MGSAAAPTAVPGLVRLHVWQVPRSGVPRALASMARDRTPLRRTPGVLFAKLLGTGDARTFSPRDADLRHWAAITAWTDLGHAEAAARTGVLGAWQRHSTEQLVVDLRPISSRGRWSTAAPFGPSSPARPAATGPVLALTRARLRLRQLRAFYAAVPPVSLDLHTQPGLLAALAVGEAPIGVQGTVSIWRSAEDLQSFAYQRPAHTEVVARTPEVGWYAEELFARFTVLAAAGLLHGRPVVLP